MLYMVEHAKVEIPCGKSTQEKGCGLNVHPGEQKPDWQKRHRGRHARKAGRLAGIQVMRRMQIKEHAAWVMKEPAMDGILRQSIGGKANQEPEEREWPALQLPQPQMGKEERACQVDSIGCPIVYAAFGYSGEQRTTRRKTPRQYHCHSQVNSR
jgi:hypothetical protein